MPTSLILVFPPENVVSPDAYDYCAHCPHPQYCHGGEPEEPQNSHQLSLPMADPSS